MAVANVACPYCGRETYRAEKGEELTKQVKRVVQNYKHKEALRSLFM